MNEIDHLGASLLADIANAQDEAALEQVRIAALGKAGSISALLKTLGATNTQIQTIFINYTLMIMIPGLVIGNIIGIGFLLIQKYFGIIKLNPENYYLSTVPVDLNILNILAISVGILLVSAISLILPSYLISKISPVKSLKYS